MDEFPKLKPEFKALWLAALRGGVYVQGQTYLRHNDKHCCLGVGCDLTDPLKWIGESYAILGYIIQPSWLTSQQWFVEGTTCKEVQSVMNHLIDMNDTKQNSFAEIANWIESHL